MFYIQPSTVQRYHLFRESGVFTRILQGAGNSFHPEALDKKVNIKGYGCILVCKCVLEYFKAVTDFYSIFKLAVVIDDLNGFFLSHMTFIVFF